MEDDPFVDLDAWLDDCDRLRGDPLAVNHGAAGQNEVYEDMDQWEVVERQWLAEAEKWEQDLAGGRVGGAGGGEVGDTYVESKRFGGGEGRHGL